MGYNLWQCAGQALLLRLQRSVPCPTLVLRGHTKRSAFFWTIFAFCLIPEAFLIVEQHRRGVLTNGIQAIPLYLNQ